MKRIFLISLAVANGACASIQPARMALPPSLAMQSERVQVTGMNGGQTGVYRAAEFSGSYSRSASRLAFFGPLFEMRDGTTAFSIAGPEISTSMQVACRMRERTVTLGIVSFEPQPMAYGCDFAHEGRPIPARFEVQAHRQGPGGMFMRQERRGEVALDRVVLSIRSVHDLEGSPIQMATPIGYLFERDGIAMGAVEINGAPVIAYGERADAATRRAILVASLALGLFWDPAESALGNEAG